MRDAYNHRLRLVQSARAIGVKPTARLFATTVPTVRKWLRRYQLQGRSGLREHSRAPHACPHKTSPAVEQQVIALRQKLPTFGAARLQREFDLPVSHMAMQRIWRAHGLPKKRQKKYRRKQDSRPSKPPGHCFSKSARIPRISTILRATGRKRSSSDCPRSSTPPAKYAAVCCSGPSPKNAALLPVRSSPRAFSSISPAAASRYATWSGKPTTAASSKEIFPKHWATASMCSSHRRRTPTRVTSKPSIASKKMSSLTWNSFPVVATSWPRSTPISSTSTSCAPTLTKKIKVPGKSSSGSLPARQSNFAYSRPSCSTTTSATQGDTMNLDFPRGSRTENRCLAARLRQCCGRAGQAPPLRRQAGTKTVGDGKIRGCWWKERRSEVKIVGTVGCGRD